MCESTPTNIIPVFPGQVTSSALSHSSVSDSLGPHGL